QPGEHRPERMPQRVMLNHGALAQPLHACRHQKFAVQHLAQLSAHQARQKRRRQHRQRARRQNHILRPVPSARRKYFPAERKANTSKPPKKNRRPPPPPPPQPPPRPTRPPAAPRRRQTPERKRDHDRNQQRQSAQRHRHWQPRRDDLADRAPRFVIRNPEP